MSLQCQAAAVHMGTQQWRATLRGQAVSAPALEPSARRQPSRKAKVQREKERRRETSILATGQTELTHERGGKKQNCESFCHPGQICPQNEPTVGPETILCVFLCVVLSARLHMVRLMLLERLLQHLSQLHNVGGVQAIPYMQVILMLTSDLDGEDEKDKGALDDLLAQLIAELGMHKKVTSDFNYKKYAGKRVKELQQLNCFCHAEEVSPILLMNTLFFFYAVALQDVSKKNERSSINEVHLVIMRLLSVFMSRTKSGSKSSSEVHSLLSWTLFKHTHWLVLWVQSLWDWIGHSCCYVFFFLSSSHPHWFQTQQRRPCSAWELLSTVSMFWNRCWSSGRASRVKKSL